MISRYDDLNSTLEKLDETRFATTFHTGEQMMGANDRKVSDPPASSSSEYLPNE